jgi:cell division septation protein DedD
MTPGIVSQESPVSEVRVPGEVEFEIVLGRRQIAGVLFVATVVVVAFSALSYLAGKALSPKKAAAAPPSVLAPPPVPAAPAAPDLEAPIVRVPEEPKLDLPLFAEPVSGSVYVQIGAIDKGIAVVLAEGLRTHGLDTFVAPGPSEKVFRVLIGPLPDPAAFQRAKDAADQLGLTNFARRYVK